MKNKKIIIAGGTGFIGQELIKYFGRENTIVILSRQLAHAVNNRNSYSSLKTDDLVNTRFVHWDGVHVADWKYELEDADLLINLAGKSVNCRYTRKNKQEIFDSRTQSVTALSTATGLCKKPPRLWINASSATIYRHATDRPQDEYTGEYHDDFSVQVCKRWEKTFFDEHTPGTRKVALRMAITIGPGGILIPYFNLLKFKLGGHQGSGRQMFSWIHIEDLCRIISWIEENKDMTGIYNASAPNPVANAVFMQSLRKETGHKFGLPAFKWMLQAGALLIGTEPELVLKSRWVVPTKLLESGFQFKYPELEEAFRNIINKVPRKQYHLF